MVPGSEQSQLCDRSEGTQPHFINMEFQTLTEVAEVRLGLDFKQDESYTPQRISIRIGPSFNLLREVRILELEEPNGKICVPLCWNRNELTREDSAADDQDATSEELVPIEVFCIQIAILSNHQNGRDAHVRSVSVYARSKGQGQGPDPLKQAIIR